VLTKETIDLPLGCLQGGCGKCCADVARENIFMQASVRLPGWDQAPVRRLSLTDTPYGKLTGAGLVS